jgi:hypothetical protein
MYMHCGGRGDPAQLAKALREALSENGTPFGPQPGAAEGPAIDQ